MDFYVAGSTDIGIKRKVNQDTLFLQQLSTETGNMAVAVLCDGMGGLRYGEFASASIASAFSAWVGDTLPVLACKPLEDDEIRAQWTTLISDQNQRIRSYGQRENCAIGSTVTALLLTERRYFLLNIGDSRAYEIGEEVKQLTLDHTVIANEVRLGNMTPEQAEASPMKSVLTKCVGVAESVEPDFFFGKTGKNVVYMLCSDGFRHRITTEEMRGYLQPHTKSEIQNMKRQEEALIELNKQRGESDNISVITILTRS
jgi:serine/threonine protein phosphatase PrpC